MDKQVKAAIIVIVVVIPLVSLAVWSNQKEPVLQNVDAQEIVVLASFYPLYEFAKEVGGDKVDVSLLVPQGVEPHDWEPTINDVKRIKRADIIVINGVGFENWLDDIDEINPNVILIDSSTGIQILDAPRQQDVEDKHKDHAEHEEHDHDQLVDPHIWLNPVLAKIQVQNIADGMIKFNSEHEQFYQNNADSYLKKLDVLDSKISDELSNCKKDFIVFHDAFSYFANRYGLIQHTIIKTNDPHADPTPKHLEDVIHLAQNLGTDIIFTEDGVDTRISKVIADELNAKVMVLSPLEVVYDNSSYIEKMEENFLNLKEALCN